MASVECPNCGRTKDGLYKCDKCGKWFCRECCADYSYNCERAECPSCHGEEGYRYTGYWKDASSL